MSNRTVSIKWGSTVVGIETNDAMTGAELREAIAAQTHVAVKRQKLLGAKFSDSEKLPESIITGKQRLLLIGSAEKPTEIASEAQGQNPTADSSPDDQMRQIMHKDIAGIPNLGNTCYLNASVQMLRTIPEIADFMTTKGAQDVAFGTLLQSMLSPSDELHKLGDLAPLAFLQGFHQSFPAFAQRSSEGHLLQHDAQEALSTLLGVVEQGMTPSGEKKSVAFDNLFRVQITDKFACTEGEADTQKEASSQVSDQLMLICRLHADTATLEQGIQNSFEKEIVEKHSDVLQRNALWERSSTIKSLPKYIFVQIARFTWRQDTSQRAKILRPVNFPMMLQTKRFLESGAEKDGSLQHTEYALQCVISHKGRTADSGHYIAWTRKEVTVTEGDKTVKNSFWVVIDDTNSSVVSEEDVKRLNGGGESHSAYVLLYKRVDE